jgi:hypothetical protein
MLPENQSVLFWWKFGRMSKTLLPDKEKQPFILTSPQKL